MKGSWFNRAPRTLVDGARDLESVLRADAKNVENRIRARYSPKLAVANADERRHIQAQMEAEIRRDLAALSGGKPASIAIY